MVWLHYVFCSILASLAQCWQVAKDAGWHHRRRCTATVHLMGVMDKPTQKALLGCNRQLRHMVHQVTRMICMNPGDVRELLMLVRDTWSQLVIVETRGHLGRDLSWPENHNLQLVAALDVRGSSYTRESTTHLLVTTEAQQQHGTMRPHGRYAFAASWLSKVSGFIKELAFHQNSGTESTASLLLLDWNGLTSLDLSSSKLHAIDMAYVATAKY